MNSFACGICCEGFDDEKRCPRLLSCGHSFCESCLKKLIQAAVVTCPNCRKEAPIPSGVNGLSKNFALLDALLAAPKEDLATRVCNICSDEHNAQFACLDCKQNFCQQASLWHTKTKLTLNHRMVSFEELKANPQLLQTSNICPEHDGEAFRFFDQDCGRVICRDCVALDHRTHNCSSLAQAAATYRGEIGGKVEQVVARAKQMEAAETRAAEVSQSLDENFEREASKIRAAFQEIHDAATAREALLVQELTQHHKAKSATLSNQRDLCHTAGACLASVVQRTQNAIKSQDDVQLLVTRSDLISTLAALAAQPLAPEADDALTFFVAPADVLETLKKVGAVSDKVTCAAQTTAEAAAWKARPGQKTSFKVTARDEKGAARMVGGDNFVVRLHGDENKGDLPAELDYKGDGTYEVTFVLPPESVGDQKMSVCVHGSEIQGSPFILGAGLFERNSHDGLVVNDDCTEAKNTTQQYNSVFGWKRVTAGSWKFHIDQKPPESWLMFGVVDVNQPAPITFNSPGSYGVDTTSTYANGTTTSDATQFLQGEDVTVELDASGLTVTNATGKVTKVAVPAGPEYKLHLCLHQLSQVTWIEKA